MVPVVNTPTDQRQQQAVNSVLIALVFVFLGSVVGVIFGIWLGDASTPEALNIGLCVVVSAGLLVLFSVKPALATGVITGVMSFFFVIYLNLGAILAYEGSRSIVQIIPHVTWFFPLVLLHQFTNFGFYKRAIGLIVNLSPVPTVLFVLTNLPEPAAIEDLGAVLSFSVSFLAFVLFVGFLTRHRDEEVLRAAMAEETERNAVVLRVSEERFRLLSLATNDLVWDADLKSGRIWWSETLLQIYGYDPKALHASMNAWESWVHPDDRDRVFESIDAAIGGSGSNWTSEYRIVAADGRIVEVMDRGLILRDDAGAPVRMMGSTTDVTELRILERKLRQSQKMEAIGQLTGGIAHDFNNLLTVIVGNAETLVDLHGTDPKARKLAETALQAAEQGAALTSRLLSFARRQALAPVRLIPSHSLTGLEDLIRRTIDKDIEIEISAAEDVAQIEVDPGQFENAILNLVINARDAMPEGGQLTISAMNITLSEEDLVHYTGLKPGRHVMITVSDNGYGMPPHVADRAFEPFFTTKELGKGSGLGLSMVWGFVQQSNGHAQLYSEPDEGTVVKLLFPAVDKPVIAEVKPKMAITLIGGSERILVVEDDALVRLHVTTQLRELGYTIRDAASAADALDIIDGGWSFDLLFTDVVMPGGMNGRELADSVLPRLPGIKVLFTSGYTEDAIVHQGRLDAGVQLLGKPYRRAELAAKIRCVLDE